MAEQKTNKKAETKKESEAREYTIPLRARYQHVARYKKTPKAVKTIKEFLVKHMKIYDRDLKKIKIDRFLNEYLWFRGIKNPPHKVKVKVTKEADIVKVELVNLPAKLKFKKAREEKQVVQAKEAIEKSKSTMQKAKESLQKPAEGKKPEEKTEEDKKEDAEKKKSEEEKKKAGAEEMAKLEKAQSKKQKHTAKPTKQMHREQKIK